MRSLGPHEEDLIEDPEPSPTGEQPLIATETFEFSDSQMPIAFTDDASIASTLHLDRMESLIDDHEPAPIANSESFHSQIPVSITGDTYRIGPPDLDQVEMLIDAFTPLLEDLYSGSFHSQMPISIRTGETCISGTPHDLTSSSGKKKKLQLGCKSGILNLQRPFQDSARLGQQATPVTVRSSTFLIVN